MMGGGPRRHIVLVGLPGSGKSTVGPMAAASLETSFVDLDEAIERRTGKTIAALFAAYGEASFRVHERSEMEPLLGGAPCVIATGGGWAAQRGNMEAAQGRALLVYLIVPADVAARRAAAAPGARPLLAGDAAHHMAALLAARRDAYERCETRVDASRDDPAAIAADVVKLARSEAGW